MASPAAALLRVVQHPLPTREQPCEPVTVGVPFPRGAVRDARHIGLVDDEGEAIAVQALPTEEWPDGSVRWALLDFRATGDKATERSYRVTVDLPHGAPIAQRIAIASGQDEVVVNTGAATFTLRCGAAFPFARVTLGGVDVVDPARPPALILTDARGRQSHVFVSSIAVEQQGQLRSTIRIEGTGGGRRRSPLVNVIARIECFAGSAATRIAITVRNPRRARHRGGLWELGDAGSVRFRDVSLRLSVRDEGPRECAAELDSAFEPVGPRCELYQDSSGGEAWRHENHVTRDNVVPCTFRGYRLRAADRDQTGLRATPAFRLHGGGATVSLAVAHFWQNFPRAIELEPSALVLRLWPKQWAADHELQGGEQKTHRFVLAFGDDLLARDAVAWGRAPAAVSMAPEWYSVSLAVPYLSAAASDADPRYRQLVDLAIEGDTAFERKREMIDEYGWRNFGDIYADHENAFAKDPVPIVSHYNNQYDAIAGFASQFMRTGDPRWWRLMTELATHVEDIDIYHTDRDKAAFNGGLFWHTYHYVAAGRCSHRSYPRRPGVGGGGPSNEHNYAAGLRLHWLLTGDLLSRDAALSLADWVVNMDDGAKTAMRWITRSATGLASATQSPDFHGPGRGAGNSILALLDGHRLTGARRYLAKAEQLIRRCIHPADDIDSLTLLDAERRWSYVVFLQALGKYLDYKIEVGENDGMYVYGCDALLHYARWMAAHEYPYLDKPEILEYPTETWSAQDIRKAEVFAFAARLAAGAERLLFVERSEFFFDASLASLVDSASRTLARPIVLLLSNGFMHVARRPLTARPAPAGGAPAAYPEPIRFMPQKALAKARLAQTAIAATLLLVVVLFGAIASCR